MQLIIAHGRADLWWTGAGWTSDKCAARRYTRHERDTLELPRAGFWTLG